MSLGVDSDHPRRRKHCLHDRPRLPRARFDFVNEDDLRALLRAGADNKKIARHLHESSV